MQGAKPGEPSSGLRPPAGRRTDFAILLKSPAKELTRRQRIVTLQSVARSRVIPPRPVFDDVTRRYTFLILSPPNSSPNSTREDSGTIPERPRGHGRPPRSRTRDLMCTTIRMPVTSVDGTGKKVMETTVGHAYDARSCDFAPDAFRLSGLESARCLAFQEGSLRHGLRINIA